MLARTLRIAVRNDAIVAPVDAATDKPPELWSGSPVRILLAFLAGSALLPPPGLAGVQLQLKAASAGSAPADDAPVLAMATCSQLTTEVTAESWAAGLAAHAAFDIAGEALALPPGAYWLIVIGYDAAGNPATLAAGKVALKGAGYAAGTPAPPPVISAADTIAAKKMQVLADADTAHAAVLEAQTLVAAMSTGAGWDVVSTETYFGLPVERFGSHPDVGAAGYMFGTGAETASDGMLMRVSVRVGTPGGASIIIGRLQKDGHFSPRTSCAVTLAAGVTDYPVGLHILKGETVFILCSAGTITYRDVAPGRAYFSYPTVSVPNSEIATTKSVGASVALGFSVRPYDREHDISPAPFADYALPSGWTLSGGVLTAGGASGDTDARRCVCSKRYFSKSRSWEFDVRINGSVVQFGYAATDAWGKTGTTVGIDPSGRAMALYDAREGFGALTQHAAAVIPAALDFSTLCHVRLVRVDRCVSVTLTDANGVSASVVSAHPAGDYYADAGNSWTGAYAAGWCSDRPFFSWYSGGSGPAFSSPRHALIGHAPVLFLGDSIAEGYGAGSDTWAEMAARALGLRHTSLARSGATVSDLLACEELTRVSPRIACVCIGANGGNSEALLNQLVDRLRARGAAKVILCRYPAPLGAAGNAAVEASAAAKGLPPPPAFDFATVDAEGAALDPAFSCGDGIHPNEAGHARMAAVLLPILGDAVASLR